MKILVKCRVKVDSWDVYYGVLIEEYVLGVKY